MFKYQEKKVYVSPDVLFLALSVISGCVMTPIGKIQNVYGISAGENSHILISRSVFILWNGEKWQNKKSNTDASISHDDPIVVSGYSFSS